MPYTDVKTFSIDLPSIAANGFVTTTIDLGPIFGPGNIFPPCIALVAPPASSPNALFFEGRVTVADSLTLIVVNRSGAAINPPLTGYTVFFLIP